MPTAVDIFIPCFVDQLFPETAMNMVKVLESVGCEVHYNSNQTCCGQPAYNSGYVREAKSAAKNMIQAFEHAEYIVTPSGSCATMFKEYPRLFQDDPKWKEGAEQLASKTYELTRFLVDVLGITDTGARLDGRATYHSSCHMTRLLGVKDAPFTLLSNVRGLQLEPLPQARNCCGFGGTFSVKMSPVSTEMVDEKVNNILQTKADYLIGADCGCLMNIKGRLERLGHPVQVMHIAEVLNSR